MRSVGRLLQLLQARFHSLCGWMWFRGGSRLRARPHYERVLQLRGDDFNAYVQLGRIAFSVGDYAGWRREFEHARRTDPLRFARLRHPFELFEPRLAGTNFEANGAGDAGFSGADERATWRSLLFGPAHKHTAGLRSEAGLGDPDRLGDANQGRPDSNRPDKKVLPETPTGFDAGLEGLLSSGGSAGHGDSGHGNSGHANSGQPGGENGAGPNGSVPGDDCGSAAERRRFRDLGPIRPRELGACDLDDLARRLLG